MDFKIIKSYVDINTKRIICETIVDNCIVDNNGIISVDYISKQLLIDSSILKYYTDIEFNAGDIDRLYEDGTIYAVKKEINQYELEFFEENVQLMLKEKKEVTNSISSVLNRQINKIIEKLPSDQSMKETLGKIPELINNANPENLKFIADALAFNNGIKPNRQQRRKAAKE